LPSPDFVPAPWRASTNPTEETLCRLFGEILNLPHIGLDDNFFALGGDSIVAIQLVSRARKAGLVLTPRDIFQYQTVEGLAAVARPLPGGVRGPKDEDVGNMPLTPLVHLPSAELSRLHAEYADLEDILPLAPMQEGMLFHSIFDPQATDVYSTQMEMRFEGQLDLSVLQTAVAKLVRRHTPLRTGFLYEGISRPVQVVLADCPVAWRQHDLAGIPDAERDSRLKAILDEELALKFNLSVPPLIRCCIIHERQDRHRLAVTVHHIVLDGWSVPIYVAELNALYLGRDLADPPPYKNYVRWLAEQDRDSAVKFWQEALEGVEGLPQLVAPDKARSALLPEHVTCELSERLGRDLRALARTQNITLSSVFQAAWSILLSRLTGRWDTVFGMTVSGRPAELLGVESMLGLFINTLPVRLAFRSDLVGSAALQQAFQASSEILGHQHVSLADIQRLSGVRDLFDTLFVYENYPDRPRGEVPFPDPFAISAVRDASHYPLCLTVHPQQSLRVGLSYQPDLFER
jgi:aryl carrier-like protein